MRTPFQSFVHFAAGALALAGSATGAAAAPTHAVMTYTYQDMVAHQARRKALPKKEVALAAQLASQISAQAATGGSASAYSLLPHLGYTPSQWNQGGCGDCWVWGSSAAVAIDYGVHAGSTAWFSVQYVNSNYNGGGGNSWACCGGDSALFANFYQGQMKFIPWNNTGAAYTDLNSYCGGNSATRAAAIATTPSVPFTAISDQVIVTTGVTQAQAIANIKAVLNGGQAVAFSYFLPGAGWNDFEQFWSNTAENTAWPDVDKYSGSSFDSSSGGHLVCLVGYDNSDNTWIILNSWGTTAGRPDGTFKIPQTMNYNDYMVYSGTEVDQYEFDVYNITWPVPANTVTAAITAPAQGTTIASGAATTFTGHGTDSSSQAALTYAWGFGDGGTATGASASHTYSNTGTSTVTETVTLTAADGTGAKGTGTLNVYVAPAPRNTVTAAITSPAATVTVASGAPVSFTGTASDSAKTAALTYAWSFGDGTTATGASASHAYSNTGTANTTETVTLTVTDATGIAASATRTVIVTPAPRNTVTAAITSPAATVTVASGAPVSFTGTASDSSKAATLSYAWNFGDGTSATGASASHTYSNTGTANATEAVTLTVTDSTGIAASATRTLIVAPAPRNTLTAAITSPAATVTVASGAPVSFTGTASDSSRTATLSYAWNLGDGTSATGASASHTYSNTGTANTTEAVTLTVTDSTGIAAQVVHTVVVTPAPRHTLSAAITNPSIVAMVGNGSVVPFTCAVTDSAAAATFTYAWTFGDGTTATSANPSHKFTCPGQSMVLYPVVLKVTDNSGATATASTLVYVTPQAGNLVNVAVTSPSAPITIASGATQSFTCKGTDSSSSAKLTYYWNFGDTLCGTGATVSHAYSNTSGAPVTVLVTVLAIDGTGCYGENVLPVTINPSSTTR